MASSPASSATRPASRAWAITSPGSWRTACRRPTRRRPRRAGISIHELLEEKARSRSRARAACWRWTGGTATARVLVDVDLTGLLLGATLATKPEEIYRALIEATAYGTRVIIETFEDNGVPVNEIVATGGLPDRNKLLMQIYADVTGREIKIGGSDAEPARWARPCTARWRPGRRRAATTPSSTPAQQMARLRDEALRAHPGDHSRLRPALRRVCHAARLLRARRERCDEAAEGSSRRARSQSR